MYVTLATMAGFALIYSIVSTRVERTVISGPIVFVVFGFLIGTSVFDLLPYDPDSETLSVLAELTLALVLFADAAGTNLGVLRKAEALPIRLLGIGLPLTIALGFGLGRVVFPDMPLIHIALLATILAPTDAALGQAVVQNEVVPNPVRQSLNVESGLNDGICVPILFLFLTMAEGKGGDGNQFAMGLDLFAQVVGVGLLIGVGLTFLTVLALKRAQRNGWLSPTWNTVLVVALSFACFGISQALGGSGFIACFVGGMLFGALYKPHLEELLEPAEGIGSAFSLLTWVMFGALVLGPAIQNFSWPVLAYSLLSLTVIRMLPVFLVLVGMKVSTEEKLFIGWFGPRGCASVVFIVIVMDANLPDDKALVATVAYTIILSILLHGVTANPWAKGFGKRVAKTADTA